VRPPHRQEARRGLEVATGKAKTRVMKEEQVMQAISVRTGEK